MIPPSQHTNFQKRVAVGVGTLVPKCLSREVKYLSLPLTLLGLGLVTRSRHPPANPATSHRTPKSIPSHYQGDKVPQGRAVLTFQSPLLPLSSWITLCTGFVLLFGRDKSTPTARPWYLLWALPGSLSLHPSACLTFSLPSGR